MSLREKEKLDEDVYAAILQRLAKRYQHERLVSC